MRQPISGLVEYKIFIIFIIVFFLEYRELGLLLTCFFNNTKIFSPIYNVITFKGTESGPEQHVCDGVLHVRGQRGGGPGGVARGRRTARRVAPPGVVPRRARRPRRAAPPAAGPASRAQIRRQVEGEGKQQQSCTPLYSLS